MRDDLGSFKWLSGDMNWLEHGGKWARKVGDRCYHVLTLDKWESLVGSDAKKDNTGTYNATLCEVNLDELSVSELNNALRYCGWCLESNRGIVNEHDGELVCSFGPTYDRVLVDVCHGYGAKKWLLDASGNNWHRLVSDLRTHSKGA